MFRYYLKLASRSLLATPAATSLMVATIALGIGIFMAAVTVYYLMANNPIPHKSDVLHAVQLDSWDPAQSYREGRPEQAPWELTYTDAMALRESDIPRRHAAMHKVSLVVQPTRVDLKPFQTEARQREKTCPRCSDCISLSKRSAIRHEVSTVGDEGQERVNVFVRFK